MEIVSERRHMVRGNISLVTVCDPGKIAPITRDRGRRLLRYQLFTEYLKFNPTQFICHLFYADVPASPSLGISGRDALSGSSSDRVYTHKVSMNDGPVLVTLSDFYLIHHMDASIRP